jgi:hypothetical protein
MAKLHGGKKWFMALGQRRRQRNQGFEICNLPFWALKSMAVGYYGVGREPISRLYRDICSGEITMIVSHYVMDETSSRGKWDISYFTKAVEVLTSKEGGD